MSTCKICGQDLPLDPSGFCPACGKKLRELSLSTSRIGEAIQALRRKEENLNAPTDVAAAAPCVTRKSMAQASRSARIIATIGQADTFSLRNPFSVCLDQNSNVLVLDRPERAQYRVSLFAPDGRLVKVLMRCEQGSRLNQLKYPKGIAADSAGNLYIPDAGNHRIQHFDDRGTYLGTIGSEGAEAGEFSFPCDVELDNIGVLYVADTGNSRIQKLTPQGLTLLTFGSQSSRSADDLAAALDQPLGVAVDRNLNVFVTDTNHHRIVKYSPEGRMLLAFGCEGQSDGQFTQPSDVRVSPQGTIFVADRENSRVQTFTPAGVFIGSFALNDWTSAGTAEGDIAVDPDGYLYLCDPHQNRVLRIELLNPIANP